MPSRIFGNKGVDSVPHLSEKCPIIIFLCLLVLLFSSVGFRLLEKSLNNCKCVRDSLHETVCIPQALGVCRNLPELSIVPVCCWPSSRSMICNHRWKLCSRSVVL